jgi:hypothetical protein
MHLRAFTMLRSVEDVAGQGGQSKDLSTQGVHHKSWKQLNDAKVMRQLVVKVRCPSKAFALRCAGLSTVSEASKFIHSVSWDCQTMYAVDIAYQLYLLVPCT